MKANYEKQRQALLLAEMMREQRIARQRELDRLYESSRREKR